jgi:isoquinoline 1-oxidoreductase subunit alpha
MTELTINGQKHVLPAGMATDTPLLWVLRDQLGLRGTKYGCGAGYCGACTVQLNGEAARSCQVRALDLAGVQITTVEGLAAGDGTLHVLQQAWIDHDVPQCGYCQAGQLMSAASLLRSNPKPTDADIDAAMSGNLCRCGTYQRLRAAIHAAAAALHHSGGT